MSYNSCRLCVCVLRSKITGSEHKVYHKIKFVRLFRNAAFRPQTWLTKLITLFTISVTLYIYIYIIRITERREELKNKNTYRAEKNKIKSFVIIYLSTLNAGARDRRRLF